MKKRLLLPAVIFMFAFKGFAQDEVLLTIDNRPVMLSEFDRIYRKNNHVQAYESKTPAEYLDMFVNFKLKVHEARMLGYDTLATFRNELAGYREQLARPYLQDRKLIDKLVDEAYYRTVNEVNASHIMVKLPASASPADTLTAYNKALDIRNRLLAGASFATMAREESDDQSGRVNEGALGWFSAFAMVYPFESAAYQTAVGSYSMPVRSKYGYHIIRVNGKRPSLGEIKLLHIMVRSDNNASPEAKAKAEEKAATCYNLLQQGTPFAEVVRLHSEDAGTARYGGQMRWLRSGELPPEIEETVFALTDSGSYTKPLQSIYGWHIFQLEDRRPVPPFEKIKSQLEERILMDERGKLTQESFLSMLKKEYNARVYPENIKALAGVMDSSVYTGNWNTAVAANLTGPVFSFSNRTCTQHELAEFIAQTRRYNTKDSLVFIAREKCNALMQKELMAHEKLQLETKYPAFKYLMEEYNEGILLFNIMDEKVWSRAVKDSAGLRDFYGQHKGDYRWNERAAISVYTVNDPSKLKAVTKLARKRVKLNLDAGDFTRQVCSPDTLPCVEVTDQLIERGEAMPLNGFNWKAGYVKTVQEGGKTKLLVVNQLLPPSEKTFDEVQGQVTADYQNLLDEQWITSLRAKYPVKVNADVLKKVSLQ